MENGAWFIAKIISPTLSYLPIWHGMPQTKQDKFRFLLKDDAEKWAKQQGGKVYDFKAIQLVTQS